MALVVLQGGHCFRKKGATGTGGLDGKPTEQEFAWAACNRAAQLLRDSGHQARVILADAPNHEYRGNAFVAVHCDGSTSRAARGASAGYRTPEGQRLAAAWKRHYQAAGWSGGWRPDNYTAALAGYYGTRNAVAQGNRTAFIAEAGFLTNPADEAQLSLPHGPERFARAMAAAVVEVFGGRAPAPAPEPPPPPPPLLTGDPGMAALWHDNRMHIFFVRPDGALIERWGEIRNPTGTTEIFPPGSCRPGAEARVDVIDPAPGTDVYGYAVAALDAEADWVRYAFWAGDHWEKS